RRIYLGAAASQEAEAPYDGEARTLLFLGALGWDSRKGLDIVLEAFALLCRDPGFRHRLIIAGNGVRTPWKRLAAALGVENRVDFVGFSTAPDVLIRRADLLLSPVRYEAYGLALQEAICTGVPILVSQDAGFVERFDAESEIMIVRSNAPAAEWAERIAGVLKAPGLFRERAREVASVLLQRSWADFARDFIEVVEAPRE